MVLEDLVREVSYGVPDDFLKNDLKPVVNRAMRMIAQRNNWTFLHDRRQTVMLSGTTTTNLPATFKCLSSEQSPVSYAYGIYNLPVQIVSREQIEAWGTWPWPLDLLTAIPAPGTTCPARVMFMERNAGGVWSINLPPQFTATQNLTFNISAFFLPEDLTRGQDSNAMTNHGDLGDGIVNLAKSILYGMNLRVKENVAAMDSARAMYEQNYNSAIYSDAAQQFTGRALRM